MVPITKKPRRIPPSAFDALYASGGSDSEGDVNSKRPSGSVSRPSGESDNEGSVDTIRRSGSGSPPARDSDSEDNVATNADDNRGLEGPPTSNAESSSPDSNPKHQMVQTIAGPVCKAEQCQCRVNGHALFFVSRSAISRHFKNNKCGGTEDVDKKALARDLVRDLVAMHERAFGNDEVTYADFQGSDTKSKCTSYCSRCGYNGGSKKVQAHLTGPSSKCSEATEMKGTVLVNKYGFSIPEKFLADIKGGHSPITTIDPTLRVQVSAASMQTVASPAAATTLAGAAPPTPLGTRSSKRGSIVAASPQQMGSVTSPGYQPRQVSKNALLLQQLEKLDQLGAEDHMKTFLHLALDTTNLVAKVKEMARKQQEKFDQNSDGTRMRLLLDAGEKWLGSQAANLDVTAVKARNRSALYAIGRGIDKDEELLQGKAFYETRDITALLKEYTYLVQFLLRSGWDKVEVHQEQAWSIYESVSGCEDEHERHAAAVELIVDTDIIPGLIMTAHLDEPRIANGPNIMDDHLAARSVRLANEELELRSANDISKGTNYLLRLVRHAVCSHIVRKADEMNAESEEGGSSGSHSQFEGFCDSIIADIQSCPSTEAMCTRIRTARDIDRKRPKKIKKMIDHETGDILIAGIVIRHSRWANSISLANAAADKWLKKLFPSSDVVAKVCNVRNELVLLGDESYIIERTGDDTENTIKLNTIRPSLVVGDDAARDAIDGCFAFEQFALGYLGVGAGRGTEIANAPAFADSDFVFNSLHYQMRSEKGQNHAQFKNRMVDHYLPPSVSRRVILINLGLYAAISDSDAAEWALPPKEDAAKVADKMFKQIMGLRETLGPKNNRQAIASVCNYICPDDRATLSTDPAVARFLHHTSDIHRLFYGDSIVARDQRGGRKIGADLIIARKIWRGMGESGASFPLSSDSERPSMNPEIFQIAAKTIFQNIDASVRGTQLAALKHVERSKRHAFVIMGMGGGKSGIYNIGSGARALDARPCRKTLVISPHNSLAAQHCGQSQHYLAPIGIKVAALESSDFSQDMPPELDDFDLLITTAHAFNTVMQHHRGVVENWELKLIFIDEFHNVFGEFFRYDTSWCSMKQIAALGAKIICMSATAHPSVVTSLATFFGMEKYKTIRDDSAANMPDVWLKVHLSTPYAVKSRATEQLVLDYNNDPSGLYAYHVVVGKKQDAISIVSTLKTRGIDRAAWLTSDSSPEDRKRVVRQWVDLELDVLVSTIQDGIDCSKCKRVYIVGGSHSIVSLLQACGRIRPHQQGDEDAVVRIFDSATALDQAESPNFVQLEEAGLIPRNSQESRDLYTRLFQRQGYVNAVHQTEKCYRRAIAEALGHSTDNCGKCSYCERDNAIMQSARVAQRAIDDAMTDKEFVTKQLQRLQYKCYVCRSSHCSGKECIPNAHACHYCHMSHWRSRECPANPSNLGLAEDSTSCVRCYVHYNMKAMRVTHASSADDGPDQCLFQERIKRILLYSTSEAPDEGERASRIVQSSFLTVDNWYENMANQMKKIDDERRANLVEV